METKTGFTVFFAKNGWLISGDCGFHSLEDLMAQDDRGNDRPVAWAAEVPDGRGGWPCANDLRAESIAAGRTIELIDGRYVARGVHTAHDDDAECASCGRTWGEHCDFDCLQGGTTFVKQPKPAQTLGDLLRKAGDRLPSKTPTIFELRDKWNREHGVTFSRTPTLDKLEAEHTGNAAMIARDGITKPAPAPVIASAPISTAHPAPSFLTLSPDLQRSSHLVAPAHGSALLRG